MAAGQFFVSSHSPVNNPPRNNLTGKEGYGYSGGCQYHGYSGTVHRSCAPIYSILGGMPTEELPQSRKENYTGWDNIVGNISAGGFLVCFYIIFTSHITYPLRIDRVQRISKFLSKLVNDNHTKDSTTSLILPFSSIKHRSTRDGPSASASVTGNCSANGTGH